MAFTPVAIAYKQVAASDDLNQLEENIETHDHRADGSQGAVLVGDWVDCTADVSAGAGFALSGTQRYRLLCGGALVQVDFAVSRSGVDIVAGAVTAGKPGTIVDVTLVTNIPAAARPGDGQGIATDFNNCFVYAQVQSGGLTIALVSGVPSGKISAGDLVRLKAVLWR